MTRIGDIVVDCANPARLARFWAGVLDGYDVAPYDEDELERLRSMGIETPEDDPFVLLRPTSVDQPRIFFQKVPEAKVVKNRIHLSLATDDMPAEVERLVSLGATAEERMAEGGNLWTNMLDPEGNEFCVSQAKQNAS